MPDHAPLGEYRPADLYVSNERPAAGTVPRGLTLATTLGS